MPDPTRDGDGVYVEAGERAGEAAVFTAAQIAAAFAVAPERVTAAMQAEFGLSLGATVDSRTAQQLAELLLADQPLDQREAALMKLGAYTPRGDADWGLGSGPPDEESDRQQPAVEGMDPATNPARSHHGPSAAETA